MNRSRITGDLVSQNNIFVDITNDRVGIGSTIPTNKLDIRGIVESRSAIHFHNGNWTGETTKIQLQSNFLHIQGGSSGTIFRRLSGGNCFQFTSAGHFNPAIDSTFDIGTNTVRVRNIYADTYYGDGANLTNIDVVSDTSPQLGGDLDVQASKITTSTSNGNVKIEPNGTGVVEVRGAGGNDGTLQLNCSAQSHGIKLKSPPHSAGQSYTLTFPSSIVNNGFLKTDSSGNLSFAAVNTDLSNDTSPQLGGNLASNGNNINIADSTDGATNRITFGSGGDLQIYHDSSHSYIHDGGTGNLKVRSNNFRVSNADESKTSATFQPAGAVELYNNHSKKFETTSSGVNVTGSVTADNQIVLNSEDSSPARIDLYCEVNNAHRVRLEAPAHSNFSGNPDIVLPNTSGNLAVLENAANNRIVTATGTHAMTGETNFTYDGSNVINTISGTGGYKISTTSNVAPQIIGDANRSAQRNTLLSVNGYWNGTNVTMIDFQAGADTTNKDDGQLAFYTRTSGGSLTQRSLINSTGQTLIGVAGNGTEGGTNTKLAVVATGSPGSNPSSITNNVVATFRATGAAGHAASIAVLAGNEGSSAVHFGDTDNDIIGRILYNHTSSNTTDYFGFYLQGTERFRIQGNGNLCIADSVNYTAGAKVEIRDTIGGGGGTMLILNEIGSSGANEGGHIEWRSGSDKQSDQCRIGQSANATGSGSNFFIATNSADSGSSTTRLTVQSDGTIVTGNVSIPTSSDIGNIYIKNASAIGSQSHQINYVSNAYFNGAWKYINSSLGATMITVNQNGYTFQTAASGTANNNITFSNKFNIASTGAIGFSGAYGSSGQVLTSQGNSSAPTWTTITGTTINSNADNKIITGSGTANTLNGESNLTFDGSTLLVAGTNSTTHANVDQLIVGSTSGTNGITIKSGNSAFGCLYFHDEDTTNAPKGQIEYQHGNEHLDFYANGEIQLRIDGDEDEGQLRFPAKTIFNGSRNSNLINETVILGTSDSSGQAYHDNHHMSFGQTNGNWLDGTSGSDAAWGMMWHYATGASATRLLRAGIQYDHRNTEQFKIWSSYGDIVFYQDLANSGDETAETCDTECARFDANGHFVPGANNARDLGTSSKKWRNIHVMDMHFSNEGGSPNSVDGTTGNWTLQEGADGIYMINNKNGKKYEMMLKEVQ